MKRWVVAVEISDPHYNFDIFLVARKPRVWRDDKTRHWYLAATPQRILEFRYVVSLVVREQRDGCW
jgi:hypothetical protein